MSMFRMEEYVVQFQKLCQTRTRELVLVTVLIAFTVFSLQNFTLTSGNSPSTLFPVLGKRSLPSQSSSSRSSGVGEVPVLSDSKNSTYPIHEAENKEALDAGAKVNDDNEIKEIDGNPDDDFDLDGDGNLDNDLSFDLGNGVTLKKVKDPYGGFITLEKSGDAEKGASVGNVGEPGSKIITSLESEKVRNQDNNSLSPPLSSPPVVSNMDEATQVKLDVNSSDSVINVASNISSSGKQMTKTHVKTKEMGPLQSGLTTSTCTITGDRVARTNQVMTPMSISEMNQLLFRNHGSSCSMIPQWSSTSDQQILDVKAQIVNAPIVKNDQELYAPIFRNISIFKRSYELMENTLKVYVYKEGEKPIFHRPLLTGIYASEGWFMKQMEESRHFVVKDPGEAHLFYMPFSSRFLEIQLYVPGSHTHKNLIEHLKNYVDTIAARYPFWNRTGGADHFLVACHDWATHETGRAMERSVRALCNADLTEGFELGKDVSLPETYVRYEQNPLRDLGGKPAKKRPTLAFFAGKMHGYLRPILLQHWENKDPDMRISGPMPRKGKRKTSYIQYMKTSRYCICPRGYEVNSPRVVEAIFYGCVPVIVSDNFVPPFFEVLNWEAFSVVVAERDVPRLREILVSIPRKKYLSLHTGVGKVQRHFLWHNQPAKYDLFHMILHSIWFNRVYQLRVR